MSCVCHVVKALRSELEEQATKQESDTACFQALGSADASSQSAVTGATRSVLDLQYLFTEGTESSV